MGLKRTTPEGEKRPEIMYVCDRCAENAPESCGRTDPQEIRQTPCGAWVCEICWDEERWSNVSDDNLPQDFSTLPAAPAAYT